MASPQARFDTSDVLQKTHLSARRMFAGFLERRPMPFRLWLLRNAHERLLDLERNHLRAAKRAVDREVPLPDHSSLDLFRVLRGDVPTPPDELQAKEHGRIVRRCLAELPELDRQVLLLRVFDGLKNVDVARVLDITADAAKKRFARALERLRLAVVDAGIRELDE
ncbi:MAG: sigma-70 family RNA polymerase sigma factor [Pirellulaceae bacterium]